MLARLAADALVVLHAAWLVFVVLGALLCLKWPRVAWAHVPAVVWGGVVELTGWVCPLTPWENELRRMGGEEGYTGGFIEEYVMSMVYPEGLTREIQVVLGVGVLVLNAGLYAFVVRRRRSQRLRQR